MSDDDLGRFGWVEIGVPDLDRAREFYAAVFGWTFLDFADGYVVATLGGRNVAGLYRWAERVPDGIRVYVTVADLEATLERVVAAGGTVERPRSAIGPDQGWWADLRDPFGTLVALLTTNPAAS
jgi:predicted enzyme related to lactoylglutathione lyase